MKRFLASAATATISILLATVLHAQTPPLSPSKEAAARRLITVTGMAENTRDRYRQQVAQIVGQMQQRQPELPGRAFDILEEEFEAITPTLVSEMVDIAVGMYAARFTEDEMRRIADFYASDLGRKALTELKALAVSNVTEGRALGQRLGQAAAARAVERIKAEGIDLAPTGSR